MAGTRTSSRVSARSSPRSSPRSARSTPQRKSGTPLKTSITTPRKASGKKAANTSPYFRKSGKGKDDSESGSGEESGEDEEDEDGDEENVKASATGLTESESETSSDEGDSEDAFDPSSQGEEEEEDVVEESESEIDSDNLDEDDAPSKSKSKRKSTGGSKPALAKKAKMSSVSNIKGGHAPIDGYEDEEDEDEIELEEGQEIAGRIYPAPKTGQVPPGRLSQNTLNFLKNLQIPERNDRDWFRSHEPAFRQAEKEWKAFVGMVQVKINESDSEVPMFPPKDVIHRIYRDVRFSSDKTPYKKSFSLSTSRGGRKGNYAAYHLSISPNNRSLLACGIWQPDKHMTQSIRHHLLTNPERFRKEISKPEFVELFGPPRPHAKGERQNVFGNDDQLKVAPKGMDKEHKDIDLLKLRSIAVVHHFTDDEVLKEDFRSEVGRVVSIMAPFVHLLNDMLSLPDTDAESAGGEEVDDEDASAE